MLEKAVGAILLLIVVALVVFSLTLGFAAKHQARCVNACKAHPSRFDYGVWKNNECLCLVGVEVVDVE